MRPTHDRVRELLDYNPETGVFTWRVQTSSRALVGDVAGWPDVDHWRVQVDRHPCKAHQLAWFWVTGAWPEHEIDHIDGNRLNNAFANLRDVPGVVNQRNQVAPRVTNTSGARGVRRGRRGNGWQARIGVDGKTRYLGQFATPEEASAAYWAAKAELHGEETYQGRLS